MICAAYPGVTLEIVHFFVSTGEHVLVIHFVRDDLKGHTSQVIMNF